MTALGRPGMGAQVRTGGTCSVFFFVGGQGLLPEQSQVEAMGISDFVSGQGLPLLASSLEAMMLMLAGYFLWRSWWLKT